MSDILELMVGTLVNGEEVISTEDLLARIDSLNREMKNWHEGWHWQGVKEGGYVACDNCMGTGEYTFEDDEEPEWCTCVGNEDECVKGTVSTNTNKINTTNTTRKRKSRSKVKGTQPKDTNQEVKGAQRLETTEMEVSSMDVDMNVMKDTGLDEDVTLKGTHSVGVITNMMKANSLGE